MTKSVVTWAVLGTILLGSAVGRSETAGNELRGDAPDLEYFFTPEIPVDGWDAPAVSNHWLWAQAASRKGRGILNMEDVRCGGRPAFNGSASQARADLIGRRRCTRRQNRS
jgi:hypothetical protein